MKQLHRIRTLHIRQGPTDAKKPVIGACRQIGTVKVLLQKGHPPLIDLAVSHQIRSRDLAVIAVGFL